MDSPAYLWTSVALLVSFAGADNFCFQCESINGSLPDCDAIDPDEQLHLVMCVGGYCSKTVRSIGGVTFYVQRSCVPGGSPGDFQCSLTDGAAGYDEIYCECDTTYCNGARGSVLRGLGSPWTILLTCCPLVLAGWRIGPA